MQESAVKKMHLEVDEEALKEDELRMLAEGIKKHPAEFARFARYLDMVSDREDFYEKLAERSPAALIEFYINWEKGQQKPPELLLRDKSLGPDRRSILEESSRRFQESSGDVWAAEGGSVGVPAFVERMREAGNPSQKNSLSSIIRASLNNKELIGIRQNASRNSPWRIPVWQINRTSGAIHSEIAPLCQVFGDNGFAVLDFMLAERVPDLDGRAVDYLGKNELDKLLRAARAYFDQLEA